MYVCMYVYIHNITYIYIYNINNNIYICNITCNIHDYSLFEIYYIT